MCNRYTTVLFLDLNRQNDGFLVVRYIAHNLTDIDTSTVYVCGVYFSIFSLIDPIFRNQFEIVDKYCRGVTLSTLLAGSFIGRVPGYVTGSITPITESLLGKK